MEKAKEFKIDMKINVDAIKERYKPGTKIQLIHMDGEPQMKPGITGIVDMVDDAGQIHMIWETGSSLALNVDVDKFTVI